MNNQNHEKFNADNMYPVLDQLTSVILQLRVKQKKHLIVVTFNLDSHNLNLFTINKKNGCSELLSVKEGHEVIYQNEVDDPFIKQQCSSPCTLLDFKTKLIDLFKERIMETQMILLKNIPVNRLH